MENAPKGRMVFQEKRLVDLNMKSSSYESIVYSMKVKLLKLNRFQLDRAYY